MKLRDLSDEALVLLAKKNDDAAFNEIVNRYRRFIISKSRVYFIQGQDADDVYQEGLIGLYHAVRDYDFGREAMFKTFACQCVCRRIQQAVKAGMRLKHSPLNHYVSLVMETDECDGQYSDGQYSMNAIANTAAQDPQEYALHQETIREVSAFIDAHLTQKERDIFLAHINGEVYSHIMQVYELSYKAVDNAIQRARKKINQQVQNLWGL